MRRPRSAAAVNPSERLVGQKVTILYRLVDDPDHSFNEVVGVVQRIEGDTEADRTLHVLKRDGALVTVPQATIVTMKMVSVRGATPPGS